MTEGDHTDQGVDQTVIAEDSLPQHSDGHRTAQNRRDVVYGTEDVDAGDPEVQDISNEQRKDQLQRNSNKRILEGGDQSLGDLGIRESIHIVHDAILRDTAEEVHVSKAVIQRLTKRNCLEDHKADDPGHQVEKTLPLVAEFLERGTPKRRRFAFFHPGIPPFFGFCAGRQTYLRGMATERQ